VQFQGEPGTSPPDRLSPAFSRRLYCDNNVLKHYGDTTRPLEGSKAWTTKHVHGFSSLIDMGAVLMGNKQHDVALPIDKSKIRSYDLREKKFWLPPFQTNDDAQALMASFHKCLE
jgi:hypothetical protein